METTTNYKLPQWVKADQIKMDDFNGAFANIDAALKAAGERDCRQGRRHGGGAAARHWRQTIANGATAAAAKTGSHFTRQRRLPATAKRGRSNPGSRTFDFTPLLVVMVRKDSPGQRAPLFGGAPVRLRPYWATTTARTKSRGANRSVSWYCPQDDQYYPESPATCR